jgi:Putative phage metallopeptidase
MTQLEPVMFQDDLAEPPFTTADEVRQVAERVIDRWPEFFPIREAIRKRGLAITYVWETKPFDPSKDEVTPHIIAKVTKAPPLWRCLTGIHLVIQFRSFFWLQFEEAQREAVLYHELTHVEEVGTNADGSPKPVLREHDLEEFVGVIRRYGPIIPGRRAFFDAGREWELAQDQAKANRGKLRALPGERLANAVMEGVVEEINAGALGPDVKASVLAGGRSATIGNRKPKADDETDVRPAGEVNVDELRGEADRAAIDEDDEP